jgi:hypothetical protein|uniref:Uncharacterized protein n=1 Tax=viral metagenome TaxID=1070528 RepID=A0A6C0LU19_9ZZZZ|tara:strand:+ start:4477 stop:5037 length:561 start_codon:yes stop_codon:yes gene_type:complete
MANVHDYKFQSMSRIGNDLCSMNVSDKQNVERQNYLLTNYYAQDSNMTQPIMFATSQPNVNYSGGNQVGIGGANIDTNSKLMHQEQVSTPCKLSLFHRPYLTVPFLGRGRGDPVLESQIVQGETFTNRKTSNPVSEVNFSQYKNYPLMPEMEETMRQSSRVIESDATEGWVRGGLPSREVHRDRKS